jgi:deazaflavin-dependent oxidoreductase (nitroreductase family)
MPDMNEFNRTIIDEFRANAGKVGGGFAGAPMVLLTTTGAKSGKRLTTPLVYMPDGDRIVIFASKAGAPTNPAWYHNLVANPVVTLEVGPETFDADAAVAAGDERSQLFNRQAAVMPQFAEYQRKTTRVIPVVVLKRKR